MKNLYIVGAGGLGREVLWLVKRINEVSPAWKVAGFIDDNSELWGSKQNECLVLGGCNYFEKFKEKVWIVIAIGSAKVRNTIIKKLEKNEHICFATLIDPSVIRSERVNIGAGSIICTGTIVTVDVNIGKHVIINPSCTIGHDVVINDCVTLYPNVNVSGNVIVSEEVELGVGTQIIQGKVIGRKSIIGAGAVVIKDIPECCTAVGIPAKPIKYNY